nr:MAG TPA: hypothetical protein [Caudoviricetes sp.]
MARTNAQSIYDSNDDTTKAKLAEISGKLIEGIYDGTNQRTEHLRL